jgi:RNA-directed DNA polymerase
MLLDTISSALGVTTSYIRRLANSASHQYKVFAIPRRNGGTRIISHPSKPLKGAQRWLLREVIDALPVHLAATAYRSGSTIWANAEPHRSSRYLLRMDLVEFFPSIREADIRRYIELNPTLFRDWVADDVSLLCALTCRFGALTIGAPTSPGLSNALCYQLDERLSGLAIRHRTTYTRYADDLFFSTREARVLRTVEHEVPAICESLDYPTGLRVNRSKTRHSSKIGARRVTGITLGSDGALYVGRHIKRKVRGMIHRYESLSPAERASLRGWLAYVIGFDPDFMNSLILKYGAERLSVLRK